MNRLAESKRGQGTIVLIFTVFSLLLLVVVGFVYLSVLPIFEDVKDDVIDQFEMTNESAQILEDSVDKYPVLLDNGFLWVIGGLWMAILVMAYYSHDHPILIVVLVICFVVLVFGAGYISNVWTEFSTSAAYDASRVQFEYTDWVLGHLPWVLGVISFSAVAVYFFKENLGVFN